MKKNSIVICAFLAFTQIGISQKTPISKEISHEILRTLQVPTTANTIVEEYFEHGKKLSMQSSYKTQLINMRLDSTTKYGLNSQDVWQGYNKTSFEYNDLGQVIRKDDFSNGGAGWISYHYSGYEFDDEGRIILDSLSNFSINSNKWSATYKTYYSYSSTGKLDSVITYFKYENSTAWEPIGKTIYIFDIFDNNIETLQSEYIGFYQKWYNKIRQVYNYNTNFEITKERKYNWEFDSLYWVPEEKFEISYLSINNEVATNFYRWNIGIKQWVLQSSSSSYFNMNTNITELLYSFMNNNILSPAIKIEFTYDSLNNFIDEYWYYWNQVNLVWQGQRKIVYNHDNNYPISEVLYPNEIISFEGHNYLLKTKNEWGRKPTSNDLEKHVIFTYHYSEQLINSTKTSGELEYCIYPNPFIDNLYLSFSESDSVISVQLYDVSGRLVLKTNVNNHESINLQNLSSGVYLYKIEVGGNKYDGRILKL